MVKIGPTGIPEILLYGLPWLWSYFPNGKIIIG
jgi:hypothetical protein